MSISPPEIRLLEFSGYRLLSTAYQACRKDTLIVNPTLLLELERHIKAIVNAAKNERGKDQGKDQGSAC